MLVSELALARVCQPLASRHDSPPLLIHSRNTVTFPASLLQNNINTLNRLCEILVLRASPIISTSKYYLNKTNTISILIVKING